nr:MAG TPA: hypothetical protein [Inoviridae sp.]
MIRRFFAVLSLLVERDYRQRSREFARDQRVRNRS